MREHRRFAPLVLALVWVLALGVGCNDGRPSDDPSAVARAALQAYKLRHVDRIIALKPRRDGPKVTPTQDTQFPQGKWRVDTAAEWDGRLSDVRVAADQLRLQYTQDSQYHYVVTLVRQDGIFYFVALDRLLEAEWTNWGTLEHAKDGI